MLTQNSKSYRHQHTHITLTFVPSKITQIYNTKIIIISYAENCSFQQKFIINAMMKKKMYYVLQIPAKYWTVLVQWLNISFSSPSSG